MPEDFKKRVRDILVAKVAEKKQAEGEQERMGWYSAMLDSAVERFASLIQGIEVKAPEVTVNVPEIKAPQVNVPEIKVPDIHIPEIKIPTITIPEIKVPDIHIPEIKLPTINVPEPKVTVNVPPINIPDIVMPDEMNVKGFVSLMGIDLSNPLPVQIRTADGKPVDFTGMGGGSSGGFRRVKIDNTSTEPIPISGTISATFSADFGAGQSGSQTLRTIAATDSVQSVYVVGANATVGVVTINPDGNPVYSGGAAGGGLTDSELRASSVPVSQVSGSMWSVYAQDALTTSTATTLVNADNRIRVSLETGGSGLTDSELRASSLPVEQVSGSVWSTYVTGAAASTFAEMMNPDGRVKVELPTGSSGLTDTELRASHLDVQQVSGAVDSVAVIGTVPVSGTFFQVTQPVSVADTLDVRQVSGANWSVNVLSMPSVTVTATDLDIRNLVDTQDSVSAYQISGHRYSVEATQSGTWTITSITNSTAASLVDSSGVQYSGSNPVPVTWVSGAGTSTAVNISDSSGVGYSGSNPLPMTGTVVVSSVTATTAVANIDSTGVQYSGSNPMPVVVSPSTTNGLDKFHLVSAASTNATSVKASAGLVYAITVFNLNAAARYLKFHNTAGTPTAGSGVTDTIMIPGNTAGTGVVINYDKGVTFSTGIGITLVTGITDADATGVAASEIVLNIYYK